MTVEDDSIDAQREAMHGKRGASSGGGTISLRDSRMSVLVGIGLAVTPIAVVGIGAWIANSIATLNTTVTRLVTQNEAVIARLNANDGVNDRQDLRLLKVEEKVYSIEGRVLRGIQEGKEPFRGP